MLSWLSRWVCGKSQRLLQATLDSALDGVMAFRAVRDRRGRIVDFEWIVSNNKELGGTFKQTLVGQRLLEVMPGNKEIGLFDLYVEVVETQRSRRHQFCYVFPSEGVEPSWYESVSTPLPEYDGFVVVFRSITNLVKAHQQLESQNERSMRKRKLLEDIIYVISHNCKNLCLNVLMLLQMEDGDKDEAIAQMERMYRQLTDLSKWNAIGVDGELTCVFADMRDVATSVVNSLEGIIRQTGATVSILEMPQGWASLTHCEMVYQSLLENALKYTVPQRSPQIELGFDEAQQAYYVRDNGIGIDTQFLGQIFQPGMRLSGDSTGTGMGLAIASRAIEAQGGKIWADSKSGEGSTFFFKLKA